MPVSIHVLRGHGRNHDQGNACDNSHKIAVARRQQATGQRAGRDSCYVYHDSLWRQMRIGGTYRTRAFASQALQSTIDGCPDRRLTS